MAFTIVSTTEAIAKMLSTITALPTSPASLFLDLEGIDLSRNGSVSILQIFAQPIDHVYLVDIHTLGAAAFSTPATIAGGTTLKTLLEDAAIPKIFFDVRNDSDALYSHYQVALQGVEDVQLMENAARTGPAGSKRLLNGLARCIDRDAPISVAEKQMWKATKDSGTAQFAPERGGNYAVFNERPLKAEIAAYCVQDVKFLPQLRAWYQAQLGAQWKVRVESETRARVRESQSATYQPHGKQKALGPWPYG